MALLDQSLSPYGGAAALQRLYEIAQKAEHKTLLDWLVLGPQVGTEVIGQTVPEPSGHALNQFVVAVELLEPALHELLTALIEAGPRSAPLAIQTLVTTELEWSHPVQILDRPRPTMQELETAYNERFHDGDRTPAFLAIEERIQRAASIARIAAERRCRLPKKQSVA